MIENLLLKREYFPLELKDYSGNLYENESIIPPFHKSIIEKGIDLDSAISILDEAIENSMLDMKGLKVRTYLPNIENKDFIEGKMIYGPIIREESKIYIPKFPLTNELCIEKTTISPYGGDGYIRIDPDDDRHYSYVLPEGIVPPTELAAEYGLKLIQSGKQAILSGRTGWRAHNVDIKDIFYKNFIIALNNAAVKERYR